MATIGHTMSGIADTVRDVVGAYKDARRDRDAVIVAAVEILGQRGAAEASGLSRRRVRQIVAEASNDDRSGGPQ